MSSDLISQLSAAHCLICGDGVRGGPPFCPACAASPDGPGGSRLLFLAAPSSRAALRSRIRELESLLVDTPSGGELAAVAAGHRALFRGSEALLGRAETALAEAGLGARSLTLVGSARRIPRPFLLLVGAGLATGLVAGLFGSPFMILLSPVVAALLWFAAFERVRRPVVGIAAAPSSLPVDAEAAAVAALAAMEPGRATELLSDLLRMARLVSEQDGIEAVDPDAANLGDVVRFGARVALDVGRLDRTLALLEGQAVERTPTGTSADAGAAADETGATTGATSHPVATLPQHAARTRERLVRCLTSAIQVLGHAQVRLADGAGDDAAIDEAARDLEQNADLHAEAIAEVEALLARD